MVVTMTGSPLHHQGGTEIMIEHCSTFDIVARYSLWLKYAVRILAVDTALWESWIQ